MDPATVRLGSRRTEQKTLQGRLSQPSAFSQVIPSMPSGVRLGLLALFNPATSVKLSAGFPCKAVLVFPHQEQKMELFANTKLRRPTINIYSALVQSCANGLRLE